MKSAILARMLALVAALAGATEAAALSCMAPDVRRSFRDAQAAPETYVIVQGMLTMQNPNRSRVGRLEGHMATRDGFTRPFSARVRLRHTCLGPWCGSVSPGAVLAFVQRNGDGYLIQEGPCSGNVFYSPTEQQIRQVIRCLRGGACKPQY